LRLFVVVCMIGVSLLVAFSARSQKPTSPKALRVIVSGRATVVAEPGGAVCRTRCTWRYSHGTRVRLRVKPKHGVRFLGWQGDCAGKRCRLRLDRPVRVIARFAQRDDAGLQSWNFNTPCKPVRTTLARILGSQRSAKGGATEAGGGFPNHLRGPTQQHLLQPPCTVNGKGVFVELDGVATADKSSPQVDGDVTSYISDPDVRRATPHLNRMHVELDGTWLSAGVAFAWLPRAGTRIDVQGFVFWDPAHDEERWHDFSGWELHPVAAWLPAMRGARSR
jgi:Divergent InlB B-repeat domain